MKAMSRNNYILAFIILMTFMFNSCDDVFEKENLTAINPSDVWNDEALATAYVNNLYSRFMPGMPYSGGSSDEGADPSGNSMNSILNGTATTNSVNYWPYSNIRKINILLDKIDTGSLTDDIRNKLKAEAKFFRAWAYFGMTKLYGGVPLVLRAQSIDEEDLSVPRSSAKKCFEQIVKDLDDAIANLPEQATGADYGRIDKGIAMAFKGRVLLFAASPQFNPSRDQALWQKAYDANKAAKDYLESKGKGLYEGYFADLWYNEQNKEVIMVNQFYDPGHLYNQNCIRPLWATNACAGHDQPTLKLFSAFPMKDGSKFDPSNGYLDAYKNRDDRFYSTVAYNGTQEYRIADLVAKEFYLWTFEFQDGSESEAKYYGLTDSNHTGMYRLKALDFDLTQATTNQADVDWIEIRFAEVLMNYGEAANEVGKTSEALDVLKKIRKRAGIEVGSGNYGITASAKDDIREAYIDERFVEFAFEGKRFEDLRRWRRFDILNDQGVRQGLKFVLNAGETAPTGKDNIDEFYDKFTARVFDLETDPDYRFKLKDTYYFYGIPDGYIQQDSNLEQTIGWENGTFDPLK
ncbi:RagB/SusD family nutrient uptake outer membrane protein [Puteibacter caeruleilacunae]|nr:RagB/SusD family nutrient uptake outer membrane protein [Puteibacter caeruleilacunae]